MRPLLSLLICLVASVGPRNAARSETIVESSRSLPVEKSVDVLVACGDPNGLARGIFHAYADDPRGIWALHARQVLEKYDNQCKGVPRD